MGAIGKDKAKEIYDYSEKTSNKSAAEKYGITVETVRRYKRQHKESIGTSEKSPNMKILEQLGEKYSKKELEAILKGGLYEKESTTHKFNFDGEVLTIGLMTDTHIGSKYTDENLLHKALDTFDAEEVDFICHCGDVFEGMSNRAGHVYECTHLGYDAQLERGIELFEQWDTTPIYMIDGNHDRWFIKNSGAKIVKCLAAELDNIEFLGHDKGDININNVTIRLWHGEDAGSYAVSYRLQKLIEAITGGNKPNVLFAGHTHKSTYLYERHTHMVSAGAIQSQSSWMESKRMASHTGFWVVKMAINDSGVAWFESRFYPAYI
jgi:predicted phosphodiesterase